MVKKVLLIVLVTAGLAAVGLVVGLTTGMNIGGNHYPDLEFEGMRGYEATGTIGLRIGAVIGAVGGLLLALWLTRTMPSRPTR